MRVRAVTIGWKASWRAGTITNGEEIAGLATQIRGALAGNELELQTVRLATQPFPTIVSPNEVPEFARQLCELAQTVGFDYVSMGPARPHERAWFPGMLEALVREERLFAAIAVTDAGGAISLPAVGDSGEVIATLAQRTPGGFGNLRFAALALCPPGIPFFPAAYHDGGPPALAIAWEVADEAVEVLSTASNLADAERRLEERLTEVATRMVRTAQELAEAVGVRFLGLDCSLAPYPEEQRSVAAAFERLGLVPFGGPGMLAVAAMMTRVLQRLPVPRTGFCGLMVPVLEDAVLGRRAREGRLHLHSLLLVSAVCGVGLDVVPLPGDVTAAQLSGIVLDMATLATRLGKPLTARLMPIPGHRFGEGVRFDFPFFAPAGVLAVEGLVPTQWFGNDSGQNTEAGLDDRGTM